MFIGLRFTTTALWLIFSELIDPGFQAAGKYWTLIVAFLIAMGTDFLRRSFGIRMGRWGRGFVGGLSIIPVLILAKAVLPGASLSVPGIVMLYLGIAFMEMLIPNEAGKGLRKRRKGSEEDDRENEGKAMLR